MSKIFNTIIVNKIAVIDNISYVQICVVDLHHMDMCQDASTNVSFW